MKYPKLLTPLCGVICILLIVLSSVNGTYAQSNGIKKPVKKTVKKAKKAPTPLPTVSIKIDTATISIKPNPADVVGDSQISIIHLKFVVSGNPPAADASVKLVIDDYTTLAKPQFDNNTAAPSGSFSTTIAKSSFTGLGNLNSVVMPVVIKFKSAINEKGAAYIKIDGQPEFVRLNFDQRVNRTVALLDSTTTLQLDTFKKSTINTFPVKLNLKLAKTAIGTDTTVNALVWPVNGLKNIKLLNNTYPIKITTGDWNSKKDTTITRNINLIIEQLSPVTKEQDVSVNFEHGEDIHTIKLMPSKVKNAINVFNPIESGNIQIISEKVGVSHFYSSVATPINSIDSINIKVRLYGDYHADHNQFSFSFLDTNVSKHFQIIENPITIDSLEWNEAIIRYRTIEDSLNAKKNTKQSKNATDKKIAPFSDKSKIDPIGILDIPLHLKTINLNDSLNKVQYIDLVIRGQHQALRGSQKIKLSVKDQPFWAEVGTNFDLLDNIKTNNFYAGVYMFDKDVGRFDPFKWFDLKGNNLSFTGGVYESQAVSAGSSTNKYFDYKNGDSPVLNSSGAVTSYNYLRDTGTINTTTTIKRIGIFFSPQVRLTDGKTDENGVHIFLSAYAEMLWQRVNASFDYSQTKNVYMVSDTGKIAAANFTGLPYKEQSLSYDYRSHYIGLGLPLYIKEKDFNLYMNSVFGTTNQQFVIVGDSINKALYRPINPTGYGNLLNFAPPKKGWNAFYIFQYRLNEVAYGITFSGEVRGLLIPGSKPVITLALSKKFDLSALLKPLVAPF